MRGTSTADQEAADKPESFCVSITVDQLCALGVSRSTITRRLKARTWKSAENGASKKLNGKRAILVSSLPIGLQLEWLQLNSSHGDADQAEPTVSDELNATLRENEKKLENALLRLPTTDRPFWINEALRLVQVVQRYDELKPKRRTHPVTGEQEFVPAVYALCEEAVCTDQKILAKEPHRQYQPSPFTLDGWLRSYKESGLLAFLRNANSQSTSKIDKRRVAISRGAVEWVNTHWEQFSGPRHLYKAIKERAEINRWKIPSESWFYREWRCIPEIVKILLIEGQKSYVSKWAPYVPRDYNDLEALQVVCGDHSERDVTVLFPDGKTIGRPWWTAWYDLRCGLIWGWHLGLAPSSYAAGLAYADGVTNYGAQPPSRPEKGFYSFIYTDLGRTYRSHNWDGKEIAVHGEAMRPDGGFELLLVQRHVGIVNELHIKHLFARGYNAKEKPIEEVHNVFSYWEQNTFAEYCGRNPKERPDKWHRLFQQHTRFLQGKCEASPFIPFEEYQEALSHRIAKFNTSVHTRVTLGGRKVIPVEEFQRLYTTRYEITQKTLALLLMKAEKRKIRKNGVQMFRPNWYYYDERMSLFKGMNVEVRYKDDDYSRVWVVLPNKEICEAQLITPTSLLNPNKQTLKAVSKAHMYERKLVREFQFITQSKIRGETVEDRVVQAFETDDEIEDANDIKEEVRAAIGNVDFFTHPNQPKRKRNLKEVTAADVSATSLDSSIFDTQVESCIKEFDYDE